MINLLGELARQPNVVVPTSLVQDGQGNVWRESHQEIVTIDLTHPERTGSVSVTTFELVSTPTVDAEGKSSESSTRPQGPFASWTKKSNDMLDSLQGRCFFFSFFFLFFKLRRFLTDIFQQRA